MSKCCLAYSLCIPVPHRGLNTGVKPINLCTEYHQSVGEHDISYTKFTLVPQANTLCQHYAGSQPLLSLLLSRDLLVS